MAETTGQSEESLFFCFSRRVRATGGRRACRAGCQRRGMDSAKSAMVGRTARHRALRSDLSRASSAARSPLTEIFLRGLRMSLGTVSSVRTPLLATFMISSPACMKDQYEMGEGKRTKQSIKNIKIKNIKRRV